MIAPLPVKSLVLRVTIVNSWTSAVAAINESTVGKGRPVRDPCATSDAQREATRRSTGKTRPENHAVKSFASHCSSSKRRLLATKLDLFLNLRKRHDADILQLPGRGLQPMLDAGIRTSLLAVFRKNICVDQKTVHPSLTSRG